LRYDSDKNTGIDQEEFIKYFGDHLRLHERLDRANFQESYIFYWSLFFIVTGTKFILTSNHIKRKKRLAIWTRTEGCHDSHVYTVLGISWVTNGLLILSQHVGKFSGTATCAILAGVWFSLPTYEYAIGSIVGVEGFTGPPLIACVLSFALFASGVSAALNGKVLLKEK
jgi:hypothetical protein